MQGYRVYWGTATGTYGSSAQAGATTGYTIGSLQPGFTYYFAVTAYDASGAESAFSAEASKTIR